MVKVGIIGATGYVGIEILRILAGHPHIEVTCAVSQNYVGKKISEVYPHLRSVTDLECEDLNIEIISRKADIFVTALPHGISKVVIPQLLQRGKRVIDHSGDFRYKSVEVYEQWYQLKHEMPELLEKAVYGLPELYRNQIAAAELVANPGCYPTCSILGIAPLLHRQYVHPHHIIIDAASGVTGAGRSTDLSYQFCECTENFKAYKVATHRHTSEIEQELSLLAGESIMLSFTPHLAPMKRGMLATIYADLKVPATASELSALYKEYYHGEPFVRIMESGVLPETKHVAGSNFIDIGITVDTRLQRAVILSAIDNLGKGASAQAVQDLNIMCGFPETTGLLAPGLYL